MHQPFISICIPAFKRTDFLRIVLDSIIEQNFRDFEVIVTDDSPDESVKLLCDTYTSRIPLRYHRNLAALGTPKNWNEGIRMATGKWIKLMHDDDWFSTSTALQHFADIANSTGDNVFIFSAYNNMIGSVLQKTVRLSKFRMNAMLKDPVSLLSKNCIGPPSVTMHRNDKKLWYDKSLRWLVDMDFYIRYLQLSKPVYIDLPLVNIGLNELQVTKQSSLVADIEIPEHFAILEKTGVDHLNNIIVYDAWWRLFRNLKIRKLDDIRKAGYTGPVPDKLLRIILTQRRFPTGLLQNGPFSKLLMTSSFIFSR